MARIFNIYFHHENRMHHATVSVRVTSFYTEYSLNNLDEELLQLLPGNKIISTQPGHYVFQPAGSTSTQLMDDIIKAVAGHLKMSRADMNSSL